MAKPNVRSVIICLLCSVMSLMCDCVENVRLIAKNKKKCANTCLFSRPIFVDDQYVNLDDNDTYDTWEIARLMRDSARMFAYTTAKRKIFAAQDVKQWYAPMRPIATSKYPAVTWIGHSTFLIQINNFNIITDPIFGDSSWLYKRAQKPGLALNKLPRVDIILLSHNHTDHMDEDSLKMLRAQQPLVMVPQGNGAWFTQNGFNYVTEYTWWQEQEVVIKRDNTSIKITSVPARHWSGRTFTDTNTTLWCGWVVSTDKDAIYFAGDTGYSKRQFDEIHAVFPSITYALLPIGPNKPDYLNSIHMDAEQAVQAYIDLEAQLCVPMHWGTFGFGVDEFMEPVDRMKKAWAEHSLSEEKLLVLKYGQRHTVGNLN
ncbi:MAG TPA: MBL fold metallo-hydrolase [Candidatus Dependentiae bacterium]|nr:MBL fold metallo-hydrolase [Candidatus Dependentiae bacterium]